MDLNMIKGNVKFPEKWDIFQSYSYWGHILLRISFILFTFFSNPFIVTFNNFQYFRPIIPIHQYHLYNHHYSWFVGVKDMTFVALGLLSIILLLKNLCTWRHLFTESCIYRAKDQTYIRIHKTMYDHDLNSVFLATCEMALE